MSEIGPGPDERETSEPAADPSESAAATGGRDRAANQWAMFIHFSILAGWAVPVAGIVLPIILWQIKKDELPGIVPHAHIVMNWILSSFVYALICFILLFVFVGVIGFFILGLATLLFSIIGGVKANDGEVWEYPGTIIKFFK